MYTTVNFLEKVTYTTCEVILPSIFTIFLWRGWTVYEWQNLIQWPKTVFQHLQNNIFLIVLFRSYIFLSLFTALSLAVFILVTFAIVNLIFNFSVWVVFLCVLAIVYAILSHFHFSAPYRNFTDFTGIWWCISASFSLKASKTFFCVLVIAWSNLYALLSCWSMTTFLFFVARTFI